MSDIIASLPLLERSWSSLPVINLNHSLSRSLKAHSGLSFFPFKRVHTKTFHLTCWSLFCVRVCWRMRGGVGWGWCWVQISRNCGALFTGSQEVTFCLFTACQTPFYTSVHQPIHTLCNFLSNHLKGKFLLYASIHDCIPKVNPADQSFASFAISRHNFQSSGPLQVFKNSGHSCIPFKSCTIYISKCTTNGIFCFTWRFISPSLKHVGEIPC